MITAEIPTHVLEMATESALRRDEGRFKAPKILTHAFARFNPNVLQDHKKRSQYEHNNPRYEDVDPTVDRLTGILQYGIVSAHFARRAGLKISRNWNDPANKETISLALYPDTAIEYAHFATPQQTIFAILINKKFKKEFTDWEAEDSLMVKRRIAPRHFSGLVVDEPYGPSLDEAVSTMLTVYQRKPDLALPVYNKEKDMYWPIDRTGLKTR